MKPPVSLILVHGDGSRVLRVSLPRSIIYATAGLFATAAASTIGLSDDYVRLVRDSGRMAAVQQREAEQRAADAVQARVAAVRGEITAWKALHTKMWKALGLRPDRADDDAAAAEPQSAGEVELLASTVAEEGPRLKELEHATGRMGRLVSALPLSWPIHGQIDSEYGMRRSPFSGKRQHHKGIDIGSPPGTPVRSPAPGIVIAAHSGGGYGRNVVLDHGNGIESRYAHLKKVDVTVGQRVEKGDVVGLVGSSGRSTGPHLHYEVLVEGKPVNPREFLEAH